MYTRMILSIVLLEFGFISASYLEAESNYMKPKLERNNIVNKKVWIKKKSNENLSEKTNLGQYIFRSNSIEVDDVLQNNFDPFNENLIQDVPLVSSYIERSKRSPNSIRKRRNRKSLKNCINKKDCRKTAKINTDDKSNLVESKLIPHLKPASVFNDYPYEVAILPSNNKIIKDTMNETSVNNTTQKNISESATLKDSVINLITIEDSNLKINMNESESNTSLPKRSSKYDYETETGDRIQFITDLNYTNEYSDRSKIDRNVFDKDDRASHQNAPAPDINLYKVVPKEPVKVNAVNERGLIKVISTLTKTFKKIMKQHSEIKTIHNKLQKINEDLLKKIANITKKFHDFDQKYSNLIKLNDKIKNVEENFAQKEQNFKSKQKEMTKNFIEFENQQKKFLVQQEQFYAVQQLILAQNEKINLKQNLISKTQSEISHRQNNFARILKKTKQMYIDNKSPIIAKIESNFIDLRNNNTKQVIRTTTSIPPSSESVKINLFSIPVANPIRNQDDILIKEKDHQPIDDLVYKFYFNNTFIDNLMKSKVLNSIAIATESREVRNNVKNKRNELTTILLPINKSFVDVRSKTVQRNKRWINNYSRKHYRRKNHGKGEGSIINTKDKKHNLKNNTMSNKESNANKTDPFLAMATSFCNEIRRNANTQVLGWCIEKALRRLQYMDAKLFPMAPTTPTEGKTMKPTDKTHVTTNPSLITDLKLSTSSVPLSSLSIIIGQSTTNVPLNTTELGQEIIFFPDNDELESNLKQYEQKPDTEGNVYYDGSLHTSDIVDTESEGYSDLLPDLNSNSRVDMSPLALDYQPRIPGYMYM